MLQSIFKKISKNARRQETDNKKQACSHYLKRVEALFLLSLINSYCNTYQKHKPQRRKMAKFFSKMTRKLLHKQAKGLLASIERQSQQKTKKITK